MYMYIFQKGLQKSKFIPCTQINNIIDKIQLPWLITFDTEHFRHLFDNTELGTDIKSDTNINYILSFVVEEPVVVPSNPCQPSPCRPNAECRVVGEAPSCSCLSEFIGTPPQCRPECVSNSECANHLACINQKCKDPCPGVCGQNAECRVVSHTPNCVCLVGFVGNPFIRCDQKIEERPVERPTPCVPSPCGVNAQCREHNEAGSCSCLPDYVGNPYEGCRPECSLNSDCPSNQACINNKCKDPCPGTCGQNAECQVINHLPSCNCIVGYTGDPFRFCHTFTPEPGKNS